MSKTKSSSGARGGAVTLLGQLVKVVLQVLSVVVLSRLLSPSDYGLIAMVTVFVGLGELLRDFGIPTAALSMPRITRQQQSNIFWICVGLGGLVGLVLLFSTPLIVALYDEQRLWALVPVLSLTLLLNGAQAQYQVVLARSHRFVGLAVTDVLAQAAALGLAIVAAVVGFGYWALAIQIISQAVLLLVARAIYSRWVPLRARFDAETKEIARKGLGFGGAQFLTYAASNVDSLSIGARWGSETLGYYNRAFQLLAMPGNAIVRPLMNVVLPTIHRARAEGRSVDSVLLRVQSVLGMLVVLVFTVAASSAPHLVPLLLGEGWSQSVLLFQLLAVGGAVQVFSTVSYWGFVAHQQARQLFLYNIVTKSLAVVLILAASFVSPEFVAAAYSLALVLSWPINLIWLRRTTGQDSWAYFRSGTRIIFAAVVAFVVCGIVDAAMGSMVEIGATLLLAGIAAVVYFCTIGILPGGIGQFRTALQSVRQLRRS